MRDLKARADVVPVRQQSQYNCMTTSLCMALRSLGVPEDECSIHRVNKVVGAMPMQGAAWEPLLAAANHYGMRATLTLPSTVLQLKSWTDAGKPVVIAWNPEGREWSHASLVFDVTEDEEQGFLIHIADPNIPDPDETVRVVPKKEFYSKWYEKAPQGFLIRRPACVIEREITPDGRQVMASESNKSPLRAAEPSRVVASYLSNDHLLRTGSPGLAFRDFLRGSRTWFSLDDHSPTAGGNELLLATRENGNVGDGTPGRQDILEARRLKKLILEAFPGSQVRIDSIDEWVNVEVSLPPGVKVASFDSTLDRKLREQINRALISHGFDGNGRFPSPGKAYAGALDVLASFGIEMDEVVSSHLFKARPVILNIDVAFSNPQDPFSPVSIRNSKLSIQITELTPDRFEAVAYMS